LLKRVSAGRFNRRDSVRAYCERLRQSARRGSTDPDLAAEKKRLVREQADKIAVQNAAARGELIPAAQVEAEWAAILRDVRAGMLALPSRLQQRLGHLSVHDVAAIDREIRDALTELTAGQGATCFHEQASRREGQSHEPS
jgi:phage terminase Nu1 subunit (DNA packaging protein)